MKIEMQGGGIGGGGRRLCWSIDLNDPNEIRDISVNGVNVREVWKWWADSFSLKEELTRLRKGNETLVARVTAAERERDAIKTTRDNQTKFFDGLLEERDALREALQEGYRELSKTKDERDQARTDLANTAARLSNMTLEREAIAAAFDRVHGNPLGSTASLFGYTWEQIQNMRMRSDELSKLEKQHDKLRTDCERVCAQREELAAKVAGLVTERDRAVSSHAEGERDLRAMEVERDSWKRQAAKHVKARERLTDERDEARAALADKFKVACANGAPGPVAGVVYDLSDTARHESAICQRLKELGWATPEDRQALNESVEDLRQKLTKARRVLDGI